MKKGTSIWAMKRVRRMIRYWPTCKPRRYLSTKTPAMQARLRIIGMVSMYWWRGLFNLQSQRWSIIQHRVRGSML